MNGKFLSFSRIYKRVFSILSLFVFIISVFSFGACKKKTDYFSYVSELRENIFLAETDGYLLRVYSVRKEIPYCADGIPNAISTTVEFHLNAKAADGAYVLEFPFKGKTYGGEMSYDNVKTEYFYSQTLDVANEKEVSVTITSKTETVTLNAKSVLSGSALSAKDAFSCLYKTEKPLFDELTDKYGFQGEIYIRLIYEDAPYYYVGLITRDEKVRAFLLNAENGKILAKRES